MSIPRLQWMKLHTGDFLASTTGLTLEETGAAILLALAQWEFGPLSHDRAELARICRTTPARFTKIWRKIARRFTAGPEWLVDEALERVRQKSLHDYDKQREAARSTNLKKFAKKFEGHVTESRRPDRSTVTVPVSVTVTDPITATVTDSHPEPEPDLYKIQERKTRLQRAKSGCVDETDPEVQRRRREAAAILERDSPTEGNA